MTTHLNKNHHFLRPKHGRNALVSVIVGKTGCYIELTHHRDNPTVILYIKSTEPCNKRNDTTNEIYPPPPQRERERTTRPPELKNIVTPNRFYFSILRNIMIVCMYPNQSSTEIVALSHPVFGHVVSGHHGLLGRLLLVPCCLGLGLRLGLRLRIII